MSHTIYREEMIEAARQHFAWWDGYTCEQQDEMTDAEYEEMCSERAYWAGVLNALLVED